jgi:uncharacterized protein (TIGR03067 family)
MLNVEMQENQHVKTIVLTFAALLVCLPIALSQAQDDASKVIGVWQAVSIERGGEKAPPEAVKLMRMTFRKDELLVRGNFQDGREVSCKYKIDKDKKPIQFEFLPPGEKNPVLGILRIEKGKLQICMRNANKPKGRPESFEASKDDSIVLITFERVETTSK